MPIRLTIFHKGLILVSVPLIFEIAFVLVLVSLLQQAENEIRQENRAKEILFKIDLTRRTWTDMGFAVGFYKFTRSQVMRSKFYNAVNIIKKEKERLKELVDKNNRAESELFAVLDECTFPAIKNMEKAMQEEDPQAAIGTMFGKIRGGLIRRFNDENNPQIQAPNAQAFPEVLGRRKENNPLLQLRIAADKLADIQTRITEKTPAEKARTRNLIQQALFGGLAMNVALTVLLTFYLSRSITGRLACVTDNTLKLAKRQPLNQPVSGSDEIAVLDRCLHVSADQLNELENFKRDMMSMVSHELRTPLSSVLFILHMLSEGVLGAIPEKALARVRTAEANAERLIRLINDLLDIDRMQAGKLEMTFKPASIDEIIDKSIESVREFAQKSEVTLSREGSAGTCVVDQERLMQVVINLLSNAVKYSPRQGTVKLVVIDSAEAIEVRVIDTGRGIPANFLDKVFEKFQQVDQTDAREKKGSGLGLAICRAIIEQHHGKIGVESEEGKGSTFWFRVPKILLLEGAQPANQVSVPLGSGELSK